MKRFFNVTIIFILLLFLLVLSVGCKSRRIYQISECETKDDCKLIYSSCTCESVPVTDPRVSLNDSRQCVWNDCLGRNIESACVNGKCVKKIPFSEENNSEKERNESNDLKCQNDNDCVAAQCCHPTSCVIKNKAPNCEGIMCSMECRAGTMDCGAGICRCKNGECVVEYLNFK